MVNPYTNPQAPPVLGQPGAVVTLLEGAEFLVGEQTGDVAPGTPHGLFFLDTRFLSQWQLTIDGATPEPLDVVSEQPVTALHVLRALPRHGQADTPLVVTRQRWLGQGMREDLTVWNYGHEPVEVEVGLAIAADFADLFEVKERRVRPHGQYWQEFRDDTFTHGVRREGLQRAVHMRFSRTPRSGPQTATWEATIGPQDIWRVCVEVSFTVEDERPTPRFPCGEPVDPATSDLRLRTWREQAPHISTDHRPLELATRQGTDDLGILRISDPEFPDRYVIAAGAPWFMTLFGRDSLLTAWMALLVDLELPRGVLHTLARFQGSDVDPRTEEEPGRILHEMRFAAAGSLALGGGSVYYGTADATPLFVMLVGELRRWGLAEEDVAALMPHVDRALRWIEEFGDRDGDGYVEYQRASDRGLQHQGWKDSWDGTRFSDGRFPQTPIALCEVQAYTYGAYIARAHYAEQTGDLDTARRYAQRAAALKAQFNQDFWLEEHGWLAMGLDADKRPIDALASNMGHCLWTGILDEDKAGLVADRLLSEELFSGWGIRTLATSMSAFNPTSYHNGSVWPHDNAICIAGLMRYGFVEHAQRAALALLDVAAEGSGRLPELFCGFARTQIPQPVAYPTSCSPQAWAAAAPLLVVRTLLRFDPWIPKGKLWLDPALPPEITRLHVERVPLAGSRLRIDVEGGSVNVDGLPPGVGLVREPRKPLTAYLATAPSGLLK
jgi:glycogen debranching enzyme